MARLQEVIAGANADVRVNVSDSPGIKVVAALKVDGQTTAARLQDIN